MDTEIHALWVWFCVLTLGMLAGCQNSVGKRNATVNGSVTLDGELLSHGTVTFHPIDGGPIAYGTIRSDGSYTVRTGRGRLNHPDAGRVASGQYVVTVVVATQPDDKSAIGGGGTGPPMPGTRISPELYATVKDSPFVVTVRSGENVIPLEMQREPPGQEEAMSQESNAAEAAVDTGDQPASSTEAEPDAASSDDRESEEVASEEEEA